MYGNWDLSLSELIQWLCRVRSTVFGLKNKGQHQGARKNGASPYTYGESPVRYLSIRSAACFAAITLSLFHSVQAHAAWKIVGSPHPLIEAMRFDTPEEAHDISVVSLAQENASKGTYLRDWLYPGPSYADGRLDTKVCFRYLNYDPNGNITARGSTSYIYDSQNRMVSATVRGVAATYGYNERHQRISKTVGGVTTLYVYGPEGELLAELDGSTGETLREYAWVDGVPLAFFTGGNT